MAAAVPAIASETETRVLRLGGKGSTLQPSSVFDFAKNNTQLIIDPSACSRPSSVPSDSSKVSFTIPEFLSTAEGRASLILLVNKLLLSSPAAALELSQQISNDSGSYQISSKDLPPLFDYSLAAFDGICALLDHSSSVLATVINAIAALSCEALGAEVTAFNLIDGGDGSSAKDDVAVASDFKVFFNGSKLVSSTGKGKVFESISNIPAVHGSFREICRLWHSRTRVQLSSGFSASAAESMSSHLLALADSLFNLAEISFRRAELLVESMPDLDSLLKARCPGRHFAVCYEKLPLMLLEQKIKRNNYDFVGVSNLVYCLLNEVWKTFSWEATLAFLSLEKILNSGNADDKKSAKKKKVVLGKGSTVLMHFIEESFLNVELETTSSITASAHNILRLLDPYEPQLDNFLDKVKEIVESNESRRLPKLPKGTRDFAKEQMAIREKAFSIIGEVFKRHGATALDTPVFELRETLMGKYGEDSKLIYDLADQGGELCSLRYDLTVPFARYVAMNGITSFKRYQIAKVYRRDNPSKGRYREFYQCDFDIAGQFEKMGPDFEVIKILTELLNELDIGDYEVKVNHRKLLDGMLAICGVPKEKFRTICSSIDKLDKQSFEQIKKEMVNEKGLTVETADEIGTFVKEKGSPLELLKKLNQKGSKFSGNDESQLALDELEILFKALEKSKCIDKVVFDLSLARGLDYYTGVIFETVFKGATQIGSIAAGGRYDNLIGMFGTKQVPAVGISLGIERVFAIMEQLQKNQKQVVRGTETQVLISILGEDLTLAAEISSELWDARVKAEYMVDKRIKKQIGRAIDSQIPLMVIVGEHELNEGKVKLKDLTASKEYDIPRISLVQEVLRLLLLINNNNSLAS